MSHSEYAIDPDILASIEGAAEEGAALVGVSVDDLPLEVVTAINTFVSRPPRKWLGHADKWTDLALPLGSLWGQQIVGQFGWEWSGVVFHDHNDSRTFAVLNDERSLAVYPWHFVYGCLENNAPATILLAFNMLLAGKIPAIEPDAYVNLMDHVHHIVPPG